MIDLIIGFVVAGALMILEYIFCTRLKNPLWGGIIPMLILIGTILIFTSGKVPIQPSLYQFHLTTGNIHHFAVAVYTGDVVPLLGMLLPQQIVFVHADKFRRFSLT